MSHYNKGMRLDSIYPQMIEDASLLPEEENIKFVFRHSIRYDNPVDGDYSNLLLTPEGISIAEKLGRSLDREIGYTLSSPVKRCQQTIEHILKGAKESQKYSSDKNDVIIRSELCNLKGDIRPIAQGGVGWYEYYHYLQENDTEATRGYSLEQECKPILDCLFSYNSSGNKLDLFCSHDSHLVMLASALFGLKTGLHEATDKWVSFTEGMFIYGKREDFTAIFRGQKKRFVNLFLSGS